jgi:hypothetical protein
MHHIGKWWCASPVFKLQHYMEANSDLVYLLAPLTRAFTMDSGLVRPESRYEQSYLKNIRP